jgi:hypothetical protein
MRRASSNLRWQIDFRSYDGTLLRSWLKADADAVLGPGYANLGFIDSKFV